MGRSRVIRTDRVLFVRVGTPGNASRLFDWLRDNDFVVYDEGMAGDTGMFVVIGSTYNKLRTAMQEAKDNDVLEHPYKVKVTEVKEGRTAAASRKRDRPPSPSEMLSLFED